MRLCPWSLALASSIPVLGLERFCPRKGCPWPWPWPRIFFCVLGLGLGLEPCVLDSTSGLHSNLVRFLAKKKVFAHRFCAQTICPSSVAKEGPCHNFAYFSMLIKQSWRPKGGGHGPMPPGNTPWLYPFPFLLASTSYMLL